MRQEVARGEHELGIECGGRFRLPVLAAVVRDVFGYTQESDTVGLNG